MLNTKLQRDYSYDCYYLSLESRMFITYRYIIIRYCSICSRRNIIKKKIFMSQLLAYCINFVE